MFNQKKLFQNLILVLLFLITAFGVFAEDMPIPANLQAAMFQKIFSFDKALADTKELNL